MPSSLTRFSDQDLSPFANAVGLSIDEYRRRATAAEEGVGLLDAPGLTLSVTPADPPNCKNIDFDIKLLKIEGQACFTFVSDSDWSLTLDLQASVLGIELSRVKYTLSSAQTSVCYNYDLLFAKVQLCFGVRSSRICLFTSGDVRSFGKTHSWDETLVCFR